MPKKRIKAALLVVALARAGAALGADDSFQFFEQEATVVTASRHPQVSEDSPVAVEVVTADDIRRSGVVNLWDLLRYRAGVDVYEGRSNDGNRALVSIRGFAKEFTSSLQVLIDGRSVYWPTTVYWQQLPVQLQDIERIEIVRGPSAALYGSNAALGVINIITKKPSQSRAGAVQALGAGRGRDQEAAAWSEERGQVGYRLSATHHDEGGFSTSLPGSSNDYLHSNKVNGRLSWEPALGTNVELFSGASWDQAGIPDVAANANSSHYNDYFEMVRLSQRTVERGELDLSLWHQWQQNDQQGASPDVMTVRQYAADALHRLDWLDGRLNTTAGASLRYSEAESALRFPNMRPNDHLLHIFVEQFAKLSRAVTFSGAASIDDSSADHETAVQAALIVKPWAGHVFRASYANSSTVPDFTTRFGHLGGGSTVLLGNPDLDDTKITNYEVGYEGYSPDRRWKFEQRLYYMHQSALVASFTQSQSFFPVFQSTKSFNNGDAAAARGAETALTYQAARGASVYANYTYEYIDDGERRNQVSGATPHTKINFGGFLDLGRGLSLAVNAGVKSHYFIRSESRNTTADVPADWRLDARLAYQASPDLELFVAGENLARPGRAEFADGLAIPTIVSGGLAYRLGGGVAR